MAVQSVKMALYGILGHPLGHTLSPAMHNAAFAATERHCLYLPLEVAPDDLPRAVEGLRVLPFQGFNVTIPHKRAIFALLDQVDPLATKIGAVNTVVKEGGHLYGYNTDAPGFLASLDEVGFSPLGKRAVLLGTGGAARAVAAALAVAGVASLTVLCRQPERAAPLAELYPALQITPLGGADGEALANAELVVNATSVGMHPHEGVSILDEDDLAKVAGGCLVADLVYNPRETELLRIAKKAGCRAIGGAGMLVHQGALAWKIWFGETGPVKVMAGELEKQL